MDTVFSPPPVLHGAWAFIGGRMVLHLRHWLFLTGAAFSAYAVLEAAFFGCRVHRHAAEAEAFQIGPAAFA